MNKEPKTATEATVFLLGGFYWLGRVLFWALMANCVLPVLAPVFPQDVLENAYRNTLAGGMALLEEAREKGYITEEHYRETRDNFGR
jgi:hypothetical protein